MAAAGGESAAAAVRANRAAARTGWRQWLRWGDFLLYGVIAGSAVLLLLILARQGGAAAASAALTRDGEVLMTWSAAELAIGGAAEIDSNGYHYRLVWEKGRIRFAEAACPDKVCVQSGWISRPNQIAACVPGRLVLKISATKPGLTDPSEPDVVVR
jgi:hypothetical protein